MLLVEYIEVWSIVVGFIVFMATIKFLRILRYNRHIDELSSTMKVVRWELFQFIIVFIIIMSAFAVLGNLSFGIDNFSLSTYVRSLESLFSMLIGRFKLAEFHIVNG